MLIIKIKKSINCIVHPLHDNILNSPFYKNKEGIPNIVPENSLLLSLKKYNWDVINELSSTPFPRKWLLCIKN